MRLLEARSLPFRHILEKRATKSNSICGRTTNFQYPSPSEAEELGNPTYGFTTTDCKDYTFGSPLDANNPTASYEAEHVLEA